MPWTRIRLSLVMLATMMPAPHSASAAQTGESTLTVPTAKMVKTLRTCDEELPRFLYGSAFQIVGDFIYVNNWIKHGGAKKIHYFKWDAKAKKFTYGGVEEHSVLQRITALCTAKGCLYGLGQFADKAKGEYKGLAWYDIENETGKPIEKGVLSDTYAGSRDAALTPSPDGTSLYAYTKDRKLSWIALADDGTPAKNGEIAGEGIGPSIAVSPDGKHVYSVSTDRKNKFKIACVNRKPTGEIAYGKAVALDKLPEKKKGDNVCIAGISPDGQWLYVSARKFLTLKRDPATGDLTPVEHTDVSATEASRLDSLCGAKLVFTPDGKGGFIFTTSHVVESFRYDAATGRLCDLNFIVPTKDARFRSGPGGYHPKSGYLLGTGTWQYEPYGPGWRGVWAAKTGTMQVQPGKRVDIEASTASAAAARPGNSVDWPCLLGPNGDNQNPTKGIRKDFQGGLKKVWEVSGLSPFLSTWAPPAVLGNKLIVIGKHGCVDEVFCFDADKGGAPLWITYLAGDAGRDGWAGGAHAMPHVSGDKVYVCHGRYYTCVSMADGRFLWQHQFDTPGHAPGHPVYVWNNLAFLTHCRLDEKKTEIVAVNKDTGKPVWSYKTPSKLLTRGYACPVVMKVNGQEQLVHNSGVFACGLDPNTGQQLWLYVGPKPKSKRDTAGATYSPMNVGGSPLVKTSGSPPSLLKVKDGTAEVVWGGKFSYSLSPPLIQGHHVFGFRPGTWGNKSGMWCADLKTGDMLWAEKRMSPAHTIGVDGCLLVFTYEGDLWLVEPSPDGFKKITEWKGAMKPVPWWTGKAGKKPSPCWTMPTIARGKIYLRCSDRMVAYDLLK